MKGDLRRVHRRTTPQPITQNKELCHLYYLYREELTNPKLLSGGSSTAPQRVYITLLGTTQISMLGPPILFRVFLLAFVGATVATVANSRKDFALLAGTFLLGLGALEAVLTLVGFYLQSSASKIDQSRDNFRCWRLRAMMSWVRLP